MIQGKMVVRVQICLFDESSEDGDEEQSSQDGTSVKVPIKKGLPTKQLRTNWMSPLEDAFGKRAALQKLKSIQTIKRFVKKKQKRQSSPQMQNHKTYFRGKDLFQRKMLTW